MEYAFATPEPDTSRTYEEKVTAFIAGQSPDVAGNGVIANNVTLEDLAFAILTSRNGEQ